MAKKNFRQDDPWFRNPMVWLVISIPTMTVIGCLLTIYIALSNPDFLVSDANSEVRSTESGQP